jgi:hypothetical protein
LVLILAEYLCAIAQLHIALLHALQLGSQVLSSAVVVVVVVAAAAAAGVGVGAAAGSGVLGLVQEGAGRLGGLRLSLGLALCLRLSLGLGLRGIFRLVHWGLPGELLERLNDLQVAGSGIQVACVYLLLQGRGPSTTHGTLRGL